MKITRVVQKIFGSTAGANQIGKFGSLAAGSPTFTTDPTVIQSLSNWLDGWYAAVLGNNSPAIQDFNAFCFLVTRQIAYLMQTGVPEWQTDTVYFIGSLAADSFGVVYVSVTDSNQGNALTSAANWRVWGGKSRTITANDTATVQDDIIYLQPDSGAISCALPAIAVSFNKKLTFKNVSTSGNKATVSSSVNIDDATTFDLLNYGDKCTVHNDGTQWRVVG